MKVVKILTIFGSLVVVQGLMEIAYPLAMGVSYLVPESGIYGMLLGAIIITLAFIFGAPLDRKIKTSSIAQQINWAHAIIVIAFSLTFLSFLEGFSRMGSQFFRAIFDLASGGFFTIVSLAEYFYASALGKNQSHIQESEHALPVTEGSRPPPPGSKPLDFRS